MFLSRNIYTKTNAHDLINYFPPSPVEVNIGELPHFVMWLAKDQFFVGDLNPRAIFLNVLLLLLLPLCELVVHFIGWDDALFSCL